MTETQLNESSNNKGIAVRYGDGLIIIYVKRDALWHFEVNGERRSVTSPQLRDHLEEVEHAIVAIDVTRVLKSVAAEA